MATIEDILIAAKRENYNYVKSTLITAKLKARSPRAPCSEDTTDKLDFYLDDGANAGTLLHYASLWGWTDVICYLIESEGKNNKKSNLETHLLNLNFPFSRYTSGFG
jgi:ankyrin repeat protein